MTIPAIAETDPQPDGTQALQAQVEKLLRHNTDLAVALSRLRTENAALRRGERPPAFPDEAARQALEARLAEATRALARLTLAQETGALPEDGVLRQSNDELRDYAVALETAYLSVLGSTSWRLTEPLRRAVRLLRRQPRPATFEPRFPDR